MVVKMMRWRPWPPLTSKKFEAKIVIRRLQGLHYVGYEEDSEKLAVEVKWKGSKANALTPLRRSVRRNFTKEESLIKKDDDGVVEWDEEFYSVCNFTVVKEGLFHPWEVSFTVFNGLSLGPKSKVLDFATVSLNLVEFASAAEQKETEICIPLSMRSGSIDCRPMLCVSLSLLELQIAQDHLVQVQRSVPPLPLSPSNGEVLIAEKDELSGLKASLARVKILKSLSIHRAKKACREEDGSDGRSSDRSEDADNNYPFDTDSLDDELDDGDSEEGKDGPNVQKSLSYGTLAYANHAGRLFYSNTSCSEDEDLLYYSSSKSNVEDSNAYILDPLSRQSSKRSIFPWRKRKLSFRSPKAKGEPLLKKYFGEEGGDDIDFDRRQLSSSDESTYGHKSAEDSGNQSSISEFGDDNFAVGSWEYKEVISRDGHMKLQTEVFFASIDQRSERAAGESACTALVAVIADWFQNNQNEIPIKSQLDSLIREGSLEWRNLCENETYKERFPDKHFDLETVLDAKIRPLSVVPEKSFIGFFHPEGLEEGGFDFLDGAMSFDSIWDEISQILSNNPSNADPLVYIVSWNDHFFILKVEHDAYYIIDTLGERLYEGCNQAYVLKFGKETTIRRIPDHGAPSDEKKLSSDKVDPTETDRLTKQTAIVSTTTSESGNFELDELVVSRGTDSCKEYIKSFLAAIPIRELQADLKKGLKALMPLHHRLQIEFHYTTCLQPVVSSLW